MNKFKLAFVSTLLIAGVAQANTPCDNFEVKVTNDLAEPLNLKNGASLNAGLISPNTPLVLGSKQQHIFTISGTSDKPMDGELVYTTQSQPNKTVVLRFVLTNKHLHCHHRDTSPVSDYSVSNQRFPGSIDYSIINR
ncbi:MAG: hypothetical protein H0U70_12875 [Tatlockia sp.]|nr:hypothetical protein [Tatlockia sp.]